MRFVFAILLISILVLCQPDVSLSCDRANWWSSFDRAGWSVCPKENTYLTGFWRNDPNLLNNGIHLLEEGKCCPASDARFDNQPSCVNTDWTRTLDGLFKWALCPAGYYLNGMRISQDSWLFGKKTPLLHNIEEAKCCRPQNHADNYAGCYDEDITISFDWKGWGECKRAGYYMTGFYKGICDAIFCIEKLKCCKMNQKAPVAVNGGWGAWGDWGECNAACGAGQQERQRTCTNPPPSNGGAQCSGLSKQPRSCNNGPCKVNGGWSDFGAWGECSVLCGGGIQERERTCTSPPPSKGGAQCSGSNKDTRPCNNEPCIVPVNGGWSDWKDLGECSVTCGGGFQDRERTCTNPPPSNGGVDCVGANTESQECNNQSCDVDGGFSEWSKFEPCNKTCGTGRKSRTRTCTNPPPSGRGKGCKGSFSEKNKCKVRSCKG